MPEIGSISGGRIDLSAKYVRWTGDVTKLAAAKAVYLAINISALPAGKYRATVSFKSFTCADAEHKNIVPDKVKPSPYAPLTCEFELLPAGAEKVAASRADRAAAVFDAFRKIALPADSAAVGKALGGAPWPAESVLAKIDARAGDKLPVEIRPESDTGFCLYLLPDKAANAKRGIAENWSDWVIFFRLSGKSVPEETALAFLRGEDKTGTKLLEFALCPPGGKIARFRGGKQPAIGGKTMSLRTGDGKIEQFRENIAWGQAVNGLQAGLSAKQAKFEVGKPITLVLHAQSLRTAKVNIWPTVLNFYEVGDPNPLYPYVCALSQKEQEQRRYKLSLTAGGSLL
jgi:hypothetical protein